MRCLPALIQPYEGYELDGDKNASMPTARHHHENDKLNGRVGKEKEGYSVIESTTLDDDGEHGGEGDEQKGDNL